MYYYVYLLRLYDGSFYTGFSVNLRNRIREHQQGSINQTKNLRPVKLIYYSAFCSKIKALQFERYLKTGSGFAFRKKHFI